MNNTKLDPTILPFWNRAYLMNKYELSEDKATELLEEIKNFIKEPNGKVYTPFSSNPNKRAYTIEEMKWLYNKHLSLSRKTERSIEYTPTFLEFLERITPQSIDTKEELCSCIKDSTCEIHGKSSPIEKEWKFMPISMKPGPTEVSEPCTHCHKNLPEGFVGCTTIGCPMLPENKKWNEEHPNLPLTPPEKECKHVSSQSESLQNTVKKLADLLIDKDRKFVEFIKDLKGNMQPTTGHHRGYLDALSDILTYLPNLPDYDGCGCSCHGRDVPKEYCYRCDFRHSAQSTQTTLPEILEELTPNFDELPVALSRSGIEKINKCIRIVNKLSRGEQHEIT